MDCYGLKHPKDPIQKFTNPMIKQDITVPTKAYARMEPMFLKKCLWNEMAVSSVQPVASSVNVINKH